MARKRKGGNRKASVRQVKAIVKKEVGKTRETSKLVSYIGWSRLNDILLTNEPASPALPTPVDAVCCYSLTGGLSSTIDATQDPTNYIAKNLFVLLPTNESGGNLSGVGQAQQGGMENAMDGSAGAVNAVDARSIANVHQLEGRSCYLKKFYATVALNNSSTSVEDPTNVFVRCLVIETRRPMSSEQLSVQVLLQNHGTVSMAGGAAGIYPCSTNGYLNRDVIKKVHFDRVFTLNGGGGATGSMRRFKLNIPINKKARWSYYYPTRQPNEVNEHLTYQGPFLYLVMWAATSSTYGADFDTTNGIGDNRRPAFSLSSMLSFMDD